MATNKNVQLKQYNGVDYDNIYPKTTAAQVVTDDAMQFVTKEEKEKLVNAVQKTGDTMTGLLTLSGEPTAELHAATKKYVDDTKAALLGGAGDAYDTLKELGDALESEKGVAEALTKELEKKLNVSEVSATAAANKVPQLDADGKLPAEMLPDGVSGGGVKIIVSATEPAAGDLNTGDFWYEVE